MPDPTLRTLVTARLAEAPPTVDGAAELVLAAFAGPEPLSAALDGQAAATAGADQTRPHPTSTYLATIEVEGFRGIGQTVTLSLPPSPGLTLIVGRNGSGKSSLSEALEMLLTGSNRRWSERAKVWQGGWRNFHHQPPRIAGRFHVDGQRMPLTIQRTWDDTAEVDGSTLTVDGKHRSLDASGWTQALRSWPPLLSHNELGRILEGRPSDLYDALAGILGLGETAAAENALRDLRLATEKQIRTQTDLAGAILQQLDGLDDERARAAAAAMRQKPWDLPAAERALSGGATAVEERGELSWLRELSTLPVLSRERLDAAVARLRDAGRDLERVAGTDAAAARETAMLLRQALRFHTAGHQGADCPVCGSPEALTFTWSLATRERAEKLEKEAESAEAVHRMAREVRAEVRGLLSRPPSVFTASSEVGVDTREALDRWAVWWSVPEDVDVVSLAAHLEAAGPRLIDAVAAVRAAAAAELERREDRWRPLSHALSAWLPGARTAEQGRERLPRLKAAEAWLKDAHQVLRQQRFDPIATQVQAHWQQLRQSSSVQLGDLRLEGTGTSSQRRLSLDVSIDGEEGSALGVMSQGELNCLALSLFLPRACMAESPFRFVVIDDPVQAMDPVKVEGLARVLDSVAKERQVIVLTHDDRLSQAVRRLDMEATILEVVRREQSVVELRTVVDPVRRYIEDALAVAQSKGLPAEAQRVVYGFCRLALEAGAREVVTRRLVREGKAYEEIEAELERPTTLLMWLALALLKDASRAGDVMTHLNVTRHWPWAADAVATCNRGAHGAVPGGALDTIRAVERLTAKMREGIDGHG